MAQPSTPHRIQMWRDRLAIVFFFTALWLPFVDSFFEVDPATDLTENRKREPKPELASHLSVKGVETYPEKYEAFYNDSFGFRNSLVRANSYLHLNLFGVSPTSKVYVGKEGWLYLKETVDYFITGGAAGGETLDEWTRIFQERDEWLLDRGIEYLFVVLPVKTTIYPEYLPEKIRSQRPGNLVDQLMNCLQENSDVPVLDVRGEVLAAKSDGRIYHRTDTHWNDLGVFPAYRSIAERLSTLFPEVQPWPRSDFEKSVLDQEGGDLARMLNLGRVLPEEFIELEPLRPRQAEFDYTLDEGRVVWERTSVADSRLPTCVVFRDSFFEGLWPFLAEHFEEMYFREPSNEFFPEDVRTEAPDIVLQAMAERLILMGLRNPPELRETFEPRRRFFSSNQSIYSLGGEPGFGALPHDTGQAAVDASGSLTIQFSEENPAFEIGIESLGKPLPRLLRVEIDSPFSDLLTMRVQPSRNPNWGEDFSLDLKPGRNIFYRVLPKFGGRGTVSIRPRQGGSSLTLNSLEIRYVRL